MNHDLIEPDPQTVVAGSDKRGWWKCSQGHHYDSQIKSRCLRGASCPYCSGRYLLENFNDLETTHPVLSREAVGWKPKNYRFGSNRKLEWKCQECNNVYPASIKARASLGTSCPSCASYGFKPDQEAFMYLMYRENELQVGITNNIDQRLKHHFRHGWIEIDRIGPYYGRNVLNIENQIKNWLAANVRIVDGTTENWYSSELTITSLIELLGIVKISADLFWCDGSKG